jgi:hypothetical protein
MREAISHLTVAVFSKLPRNVREGAVTLNELTTCVHAQRHATSVDMNFTGLRPA